MSPKAAPSAGKELMLTAGMYLLRSRKGGLMGGRGLGSVYPRCGCRQGPAGKQQGASCPQLGQDGHGSWFVSLDLPWVPGGGRRRVRRGGYPTRQAAGQALDRLRAPGGRVLTVADWLVTWLETRVRVRDSTRRAYAAHIRLHLAPRLGTILLAELHAGHLEKAFMALLGRQGMSPAMARRVHATLRSALNAAVRERLLADNPARYLKLPRGTRPRAVVRTRRRVRQWLRTGVRRAVAVWTPAQAATFLAAAENQRRMRATGLVCPGAGAGLIRGDLRDVRGSDVACRSGGAVVTVRGARPRAVPVLARYHAPLLAAARFAGDALIAGGTDPGRRNITNPLTAALDGGGGLPRLDTSRLRATWLRGCADLLGLATFMHAAGISCSQRLGDLVAGLDPASEVQAVRLLGGAR